MMYDYFSESLLWCKPLNINGYTQHFDLLDQEFKPLNVQLYQHFLIFNNEVLYSHKLKKKQKWIDIFNLYIKRVINQQHDLLGIVMRKGNQTVTIYGDIGPLETLIRKFSIQTNFTEKYKIVHKVGLGNSSAVYKVKERFQNISYAAKILKKIPNSDAIKIEVNILRRLNFKHLVQLQEVYETETHVILILEYLSGGDLQEYMALHKIVDENQAKAFLKQILEALQYLHQYGIFHRDLKLENVMLGKNNQIVIADFGLADYWNSEGKYQFTRCGTPGYVAPEVLQDKQYDLRCDVYSAGIMFYILVSGKHPFDSKTFEETVEKNYMGIINFDNLPISQNGLSYLKLLLNNDYKTRITVQQALHHEYMGYAKPKININLFKLKSKPQLDITNRVKTHSTCDSPRQLFSQRVTVQSIHSPKSPQTPGSGKSSEISSPLNGLIKIRTIRRSKFQNT